MRSTIPVLTAESVVLRSAARRAAATFGDSCALSLLDFGYGTGRVTNDFALEFPGDFGSSGLDLHVIAYDVSGVGLTKAMRKLTKGHGFDIDDDVTFNLFADTGYVAGSARRMTDATTTTVTFVHGNEHDDSTTVRDLVLEANGDEPFSLTTSWYSALSHIPTVARRAAFFDMLSEVTDSRGEIVVAPSVSGDLVDLQQYWNERRLAGDIGDLPIEIEGDVIYQTELSQENFWHVFGTDLWELLEQNLGPGQTGWLEAIRLPGEEFRSREEEQANYRGTQEFNRRVGRRPWTAAEYRSVHTAAAVRTGSTVLEAN